METLGVTSQFTMAHRTVRERENMWMNMWRCEQRHMKWHKIMYNILIKVSHSHNFFLLFISETKQGVTFQTPCNAQLSETVYISITMKCIMLKF